MVNCLPPSPTITEKSSTRLADRGLNTNIPEPIIYVQRFWILCSAEVAGEGKDAGSEEQTLSEQDKRPGGAQSQDFDQTKICSCLSKLLILVNIKIILRYPIKLQTLQVR